MNKPIDLRSDTVTKPTPEMRKAMAEAEVGDDVYREDPTVNKLQEKSAELFGKEAGLYVPSGSMGNQVAVKTHTLPGQEVIGDSDCHIFNFEMSAMSQFSGVMPRMVHTKRGFLGLEDVKSAFKPGSDHSARTGLVALENTHNLRGGGIYPADEMKSVIDYVHKQDIPIHLDGARSLNAAVASGVTPAELTDRIDSVMFCFSKGLGAPVGSMVVGKRDFIEEAHHQRKRLGGGMRQAGIIAAACLYSLDHHIDRLADDHEHAKIIGKTLSEVGLNVDPVETNIIFCTTAEDNAQQVSEQLSNNGVLCFALGPNRLRMVTHLDVSAEDAQRACEVIKQVLG